MGVVGEPLVRSRDQSRLAPSGPLLNQRRPLTTVQLLGMAYEDWNEIEDEDQDELQDPSVGLHVPRLSYALIQLPRSGSRVNAT